MKLKVIRRASLFLFLLASTWPSPPAHAEPQNCAGDLCGGQFIPDEDQTGWGNFQRSLTESLNGFNQAPGIRHANDLISGMANNLLSGIATPLELTFGGWMQRNVWDMTNAIPNDLIPGWGDDLGIAGLKGIDDAGLLMAGALKGGRIGKSPLMDEIGDDLSRVTAALPRAVNPNFAPKYRSAPNWSHNRDAWVAAAKAGNMEGMAAAKANYYGDLIKTINYSNSRHAAIQLERMAEVGRHNFVIVPRGSRMELLVANPKGMMQGLSREFGVKHIQLANGRSIIAGGTMNVSRSPIGEPIVRIMNDTGTYGPNMPMTPERIETMTNFVHDAFGGQVLRENIIFESFNP